MTDHITDRHLAELLDYFRQNHMTVTTVESCTGGLLAGRITDIPGSSDVFKQSYVTYCDQAKHRLVGVGRYILKKYTAVSPQTAAQMARGGAKAAKAEYCLAVTGYAGPAADETDTSVGLVYISCYFKGKVIVNRLSLAGSRKEIRRQAVNEALLLLASCVAHSRW